MNFDFSAFSANQRYHLMTQTIIPRPIAWALTDSGNGSFNLAPFSYFTAVSSAPPILMLSVGKKPNGDDKDTLTNIIKNKKVVIHIASEQHASLVTQTAQTLAHGESELTDAGIKTTEFANFSLPRIAQCDIAYGCELYEIKPLGDVPQSLIFVEVKQVYINDNVVDVDEKQRIKVHADKIQPLARLGGAEYATINNPFEISRPK
ncbi:flavin reductase family protein [Colwellia sp. 4_MG-2023]|jgi:flavin reductase (DIM6/NTAB) family NADH-FMN oxidoreductase RutF|uniref:flavin reductase family protein n=1 Tax=unclassified Colwellia TaxID=196834 RepID=UPI0026E23634|nr:MULTISPECIES: flavin reductase family protein [unclassified Colwellia]MDO6486479.1 flavin reductase family protein [Colwellia sp. 6_MG-2023]MDO6506357.1 flavin reductase family protein [Colwellia sp. 5_MG-2023]MDO6555181.1 flavin reductase family protein [Colwellia sp. 4_MG-2023]